MSRSKELNRINDAIQHKNEKELLWALKYCQNRLSLARMNEHKKYFNDLINDITRTLQDIEE